MTQTTRTLNVKKTSRSFLRLAAAAAGLFALAACASVPPPPNQELQAAEMAIANADRARVADHASPELSEAREKLAAAHDAVQREQMLQAKRLAEQARVDAELATAKAELVKAETINDEMRKSIDTLEQEMQRNSGARR